MSNIEPRAARTLFAAALLILAVPSLRAAETTVTLLSATTSTTPALLPMPEITLPGITAASVAGEAEPVFVTSSTANMVPFYETDKLEASLESLIAPAYETSDTQTFKQFEAYVQSKHKAVAPININEVVLRTLAKNLNIRIQDLTNRISHDEIHAQEGIYDLNLGASVQATRAQVPSAVTTGTNNVLRTRGLTGQVSASQLLPTGGTVELLFGGSQNYTNAFGTPSPNYGSQGGISLTQPLLRNAGPLVTEANIILAQYNNLVQNSQLKLQVINAVSQSMQTYFDLVYARANVDVLRISLVQAQELLRVNTEKYRAGVVPELDVLQAEADVASRQSSVITALQQVETVADLLKTQLAEICEMREVMLTPVDLPGVPEYPIDERRFLSETVLYRPEFAQARMAIEKNNLNLRVAKNQTNPELDLFAQYTALGADDSGSGAFNQSVNNEYGNWQLGLQLNYPLQNRAARYRFHEAEKNLGISFLQLQQVRDQAVQAVRLQLRNVETNRQQIIVGRSTVEFNVSKVDTGMKRQAVGLATSFDVLQFQNDLANARSQLIAAMVNYNKSIIALEAVKGTLLDRLNVKADGGVIIAPASIPKKPLASSNE